MSVFVRLCPLMSAKDIPPKIFLLRRFDLVAFKSAYVRWQTCGIYLYPRVQSISYVICLKELRTFEPKSVHILNFPGRFLINYSKMNLKDFIKPVLSICQKYFLVMTKKLFETTNDGVRSTGTVLISIKIQKIKILKIWIWA